MRRLGLVLLATGSLAATAQASILPDNNLWLQDNLEANTGITQEQFDAVINETSAIFAPIIQSFGGQLAVQHLWTDPTVNANASQSGNTWNVNMYGGLARRAEVTRDGFSMVLCHEIGHHLGGFPFVSNWAADEGQADYFATHACPQLLWGMDTAGNAAARAEIPATPKAKCDAVYNTEDAQNLCYRTVIAGKHLADLLGALGGTEASYDTPDTSVVRTTNHAHPAAQCRLDTYIAGALCTNDYDKTVIAGKDLGAGRNGTEAESRSATQYCASRDNFEFGTRPTCWFHPGI